MDGDRAGMAGRRQVGGRQDETWVGVLGFVWGQDWMRGDLLVLYMACWRGKMLFLHETPPSLCHPFITWHECLLSPSLHTCGTA